MLKKFNLLRGHTDHDMINASTEDASRTFEKKVSEVRQATERRKEGNANLREAIASARARTSPFIEFEDAVGAARERRRKRRNA